MTLTPAEGVTGKADVTNVFTGDSLDTAAVDPADVTLTDETAVPSGYLTLNTTDGTVDVAANTPAGTYELTYKICEIANPTNCDSATASVTVGTTLVIDAVDNAVVTLTPAEGVTGKADVTNVFTGDSLDTAAVDPADVTLTDETAVPSGYLTLNTTDGTVDVAANTPAGTYELTYKICEIANPTNCDTAKASVTVGATLVIDAVDNPVETLTPAEGVTGKADVTNVFTGDSLDTAAVDPTNVTLTDEVADPSGYLTLNTTDGTVDVAANTPAGTYELTYKICEIANPTNCDSATASVTVGTTLVIDAVDNAVGDTPHRPKV